LDLPISFFLPPEFSALQGAEAHLTRTIIDLRGQIHNLTDHLEKIRKMAVVPTVIKENPPA
jgi:hypothetical protein